MERAIYSKLQKVQQELKAPKSQVNKHYNYSYRNQEDILEAVKPLLVKNGLTIYITDEVKLIGERFYVEAKVYLADTESGEEIFVTAYAREEMERKGMDMPQITGASSSYARKYALNGLFLIDDTKDADFYDKERTEKVTRVDRPVNTGNPPVKPVLTDKCEDCNAGIVPAVAMFSKKSFGKKLCMSCQKKEKK